ncbi:MAG: hypothetical protein JW974_01895 [Alphaproteobacteria bacterium]|nr:hypothetical protein [Alphaproteobacteria bacterium]MBN2675532.1 hypothetical protein [Alphaproteobacteria bacterium]
MKKLFFAVFCALLFIVPAHASWGIVDSLNLAPFVPIVLDALMSVATGSYEFFVGNGTGIIYVFIWGILGVSIGLYLVKMYFPKSWLGFFGFKGGGEMWEGKTSGMQITEKLLKDAMRAIIAATILLQIKPIYVTDWIVNPFLRFGAIYTENITDSININGQSAKKIKCPKSIIEKGWISEDSCNFLVQPVSVLSNANNQIIKRGFEFINRGLIGLMTLVPHGGEDFLNLLTGIFLVFSFVSSNFFMALLIIQGIFNFGMSLILYPFQVLTWVAKPKNPDKWLDFWPPFEGIIKSLQQLVITMIACSFILVINIAIIRALFQWNSSVFVVAAGGSATSNVPTVTNSVMGFGQHSILWLSTILTFYLMYRIFDMTRDMLKKYAPGMDGLYNKVKDDPKKILGNIKNLGSKIGTAAGWIKKK